VWFFKGLPSRIGHLLDISLRDLERVLYFEAYVVSEPGDTELKFKQLLSEEQYRKAREEYGYTKFKASMGAEAIKELLKRENVDKLAEELRAKMRAETSAQKKLKFAKRLKVVDSFRKSSNKPGSGSPLGRPRTRPGSERPRSPTGCTRSRSRSHRPGAPGRSCRRRTGAASATRGRPSRSRSPGCKGRRTASWIPAGRG
jgi:hypothetical protein